MRRKYTTYGDLVRAAESALFLIRNLIDYEDIEDYREYVILKRAIENARPV